VNYYTILTDKTKELARGQKSLQEGGCPLATGSWPIPMLAPGSLTLSNGPFALEVLRDTGSPVAFSSRPREDKRTVGVGGPLGVASLVGDRGHSLAVGEAVPLLQPLVGVDVGVGHLVGRLLVGQLIDRLLVGKLLVATGRVVDSRVSVGVRVRSVRVTVRVMVRVRVHDDLMGGAPPPVVYFLGRLPEVHLNAIFLTSLPTLFPLHCCAFFYILRLTVQRCVRDTGGFLLHALAILLLELVVPYIGGPAVAVVVRDRDMLPLEGAVVPNHRLAVDLYPEGRVGDPLLFTLDLLHGHAAWHQLLFPHGLRRVHTVPLLEELPHHRVVPDRHRLLAPVALGVADGLARNIWRLNAHRLRLHFAFLLLPEPADFLRVVAPHDRLIAEDVDALRVRVLDALEGICRTRWGSPPLLEREHAWKQQEYDHSLKKCYQA